MEQRRSMTSKAKAILKKARKILLFPLKAMFSVIRRGRMKKNKNTSPLQNSSSNTLLNVLPERHVVFSDTLNIYTYKRNKHFSPSLTLRGIADSFPPKKMECAERLRISSKKTALSERVLQALDRKREKIMALKEILKKEKPKMFAPKRNKSKVLSILDGYSEASVSDALYQFSPKDSKDSNYSEEEKRRSKKKQQKKEDIKEKKHHRRNKSKGEMKDEKKNEEKDKRRKKEDGKSKKKHSKRKEEIKEYNSTRNSIDDIRYSPEKEYNISDKDNEESPIYTRKSKSRESITKDRNIQPEESVSSISLKIYDILKKHASNSSLHN